MRSKNERQPIRHYFYGSIYPKMAAQITVFAAIELAILSSSFQIFYSILLLGEICTLVWWLYEHFATDSGLEEQYDQCRVEDIGYFSERALNKLGLVSEQISLIAPIKVFGPYDTFQEASRKKKRFSLVKLLLFPLLVLAVILYLSTAFMGILAPSFAAKLPGALLTLAIGAASVWWMRKNAPYSPRMQYKLGSDKRFRYSMVLTHIFLFSETQVYVYAAGYDICTGNIHEETTSEFFYQDIDCVITGEEHRRLPARKETQEKVLEYFKLIVTSGTSTHAYADCETSILESQVMGMRELLRNKKEEMFAHD